MVFADADIEAAIGGAANAVFFNPASAARRGLAYLSTAAASTT